MIFGGTVPVFYTQPPCDRSRTEGELTDQILYRLTEENFPETLYIMPELDSRYRQLETKRLRDCVRGWKPELYLDEIEDEYAIACMLYDMREYLDSGKEIYP